ncbi:hypothetical protein R3P38DRAFT_279724 [Favolaschia claudopus]|uniref:NADH dehydrogenase subunit 4 n=1 Tax=Favolaschia claudopus TaxID=2862362 RepID=A0AAV9ZQ94_9AGAR
MRPMSPFYEPARLHLRVLCILVEPWVFRESSLQFQVLSFAVAFLPMTLAILPVPCPWSIHLLTGHCLTPTALWNGAINYSILLCLFLVQS